MPALVDVQAVRSQPDKIEPIRVGVRALRDNLTHYLAQVRAGAEITVLIRGQAIAQLSPLAIALPHQRRFGGLRGETVIPDDFDQMPDDLMIEFEKSLLGVDAMPGANMDSLLPIRRAL